MNVKHLILLLMASHLSGCSPKTEAYPSEEYVLIEFAAKLEEDYSKLNPEEKKEASQKESKDSH